MGREQGLKLAPDSGQDEKVAWIRRAADWLDPTVAADWPEVDGADEPYWFCEYLEGAR